MRWRINGLRCWYWYEEIIAHSDLYEHVCCLHSITPLFSCRKDMQWWIRTFRQGLPTLLQKSSSFVPSKKRNSLTTKVSKGMHYYCHWKKTNLEDILNSKPKHFENVKYSQFWGVIWGMQKTYWAKTCWS